MVYEKKRSGDPDYDDKVPLVKQVGEVVKGDDGREVRITTANGPQNLDGTHANLEDPKGDETDNRPAPGEQATEESEVQTYDTKTVLEAAGEPVNAEAPVINAGPQSGDEVAAESAREDAEAAKPRGRRARGTSAAE